MSRHKVTYDEDDLLDDYDDDDDYDEYDDYGENDDYAEEDEVIRKAAEEAANKLAKNKKDADKTISSILEKLNGPKSADAGVSAKVSKDRVKQILELYEYDPDRTLDYFVKQKSTNVSTTARPTAAVAGKTEKSTTIHSSVKASNVVLNTKSESVQKEKEVSQSAAANVARNDLDAFGFSSDLKEYASDDDLLPEGKSLTTSRVALTVIIAGHVDAGKSTLIGNLVKKSDQIKDAKDDGRKVDTAMPLAWLTDESQSERDHGVTIDIAERFIKTSTRDLKLLDSPGHRDFIPNMISGAAAADVAVLVIPGSHGEYETSMGEKAQTREHAVILKAMGINQVIVAVNKLESVNPPWDMTRYRMIASEVQSLLVSLAFKSTALQVVPISGMTGDNLYDVSPSCPLKFWYDGPTLIESIERLHVPKRSSSLQCRALTTSSQTVDMSDSISKKYRISVRVLQGVITVNKSFNITMNPYAWIVINITTTDSSNQDRLLAGQDGSIVLARKISAAERNQTMPNFYGEMIFKGKDVVKVATAFKATIVTLDNIDPILPGSSFQLYLLGEEVECQITKLYRVKSREKGVLKYPKCISSKRTASVRIETSKQVIIETSSTCKALSRFALRSHGKICAVGLCSQLPQNGSVFSHFNVSSDAKKFSSAI